MLPFGLVASAVVFYFSGKQNDRKAGQGRSAQTKAISGELLSADIVLGVLLAFAFGAVISILYGGTLIAAFLLA